MTLGYTLNRLLTEQAVIERNMAGQDAYGADRPDDWQLHVTVACLSWWDRSAGVRSANRTYVDPARTVPISQGGMLLPLGTDVTEKDRITQINVYDPVEGEWVPGVVGIIEIAAILDQSTDHLEVNIIRAHLGA